MICKIVRGADAPGLVRYLMGAGRANEHSDQRVIAASEGMVVRLGCELSAGEVRDLGAQLNMSKGIFGTEVTIPVKNEAGEIVGHRDAHVWHCSLSLPAGDRELGDEEWASVAREVVGALGFEGPGRAPAPWVAVRHGTSRAGHDHLHLAVQLVREDGSAASTWRDRVTLSKVCAGVERRYGLHRVEGRARGAGMPGLSRAELERTAREGRSEPVRVAVARRVRAAAVASRDEGEFVRRLRHGGLAVRPRYDRGSCDRVVGYSVAWRAGQASAPIWYGGGRLARDLTLPALRRGWQDANPADPAIVGQWASPRGRQVTPGREARQFSAASWEQSSRGLAEAADRLAHVDPAETAVWARAAGELAGVVSALAARVEPKPGHLARAADRLAASAQGPREPDQAGRQSALREAAMAMAQVQMSSVANAASWALWVAQLARLAQQIEAAHRARVEADTAAKVAAEAWGGLVEIGRQWSSSPPELAGESGESPGRRDQGSRRGRAPDDQALWAAQWGRGQRQEAFELGR